MLARLLPTMGPLDVVLVMDADTIMVDEFLERAIAELEALPELDAVGGVFYGDSTPGLLGDLQRNDIAATPENRTPPRSGLCSHRYGVVVPSRCARRRRRASRIDAAGHPARSTTPSRSPRTTS